jgi:hypothetical protein
MMKRYVRIGLLMGVATLAAAPSAFAQFWGRETAPRAGACFYEDVNFRGRYFCTAAGRDIANLPGNINDEISSVRLLGNAQVTLFRDPRFQGQSRVIDRDIADLRRMGFNDRISSYTVDQSRFVDRRDRRDDLWGRDRDDRRTEDRGGAIQRWPGNGQVNNSRWSYDQAQTIVRNAYRSVLRREPDPQGLRTWTDQVISNNWTQRDLEARLRNSDEYREMVRSARRR